MDGISKEDAQDVLDNGASWLVRAFVWDFTPQGHEFWEAQCNDGALSNEGRAILESVANEGKLTIRAGRYYKTRDGRKVGPMHKWAKGVNQPWVSDTVADVGDMWRDDGTSEYSPHLIAEWVDEPAVRKFPIGSRVVRTNGLFSDIHGTVTGHISDKYNTVKWDNDGGNSDTWQDYELRLVAPATSDKEESDAELSISFAVGATALDAEIDRVKKRLKKLAKKARKMGIRLDYDLAA